MPQIQHMFDVSSSLSLTHSVASQEYQVVRRTTCQMELVLSEEQRNFCPFLLPKAQSFRVTLSQSRMVYTFLLLFLCHLFLAWKQKSIVISSHMDNLS